jgi:signal recognition particle receptor subunit beta
VDLPSDARTRPTWGKFKTLEKASPAVLVYVVDANKESLRRETEYLFRDLNVETLIHRGVTCIVLANKSDLRTAMPPKVFQARFLKEWERLQQAETRSAPQMPAVDAHAKQESSKDVMQRLVLFHGSAKTGEGLSALRMVFHQALHPKRR